MPSGIKLGFPKNYTTTSSSPSLDLTQQKNKFWLEPPKTKAKSLVKPKNHPNPSIQTT